jgi:hypothetical protein
MSGQLGHLNSEPTRTLWIPWNLPRREQGLLAPVAQREARATV